MQYRVAHAAYQQQSKRRHTKNASLNRLKTHRYSDTQSRCTAATLYLESISWRSLACVAGLQLT